MDFISFSIENLKTESFIYYPNIEKDAKKDAMIFLKIQCSLF